MLADKESQVLKGNLTSFVAAKNLLDTYFAGVEINALWYNALRFTNELLGEGGNNNLAETLNVLAEKPPYATLS